MWLRYKLKLIPPSSSKGMVEWTVWFYILRLHYVWNAVSSQINLESCICNLTGVWWTSINCGKPFIYNLWLMKLVAGLKFAYIQLAKLAVIVRLFRRNGFDLMVKTYISLMQLVCQSSSKKKNIYDRKIFFSVSILSWYSVATFGTDKIFYLFNKIM